MTNQSTALEERVTHQDILRLLESRGMVGALIELVAEVYPHEACGLVSAFPSGLELRAYPNAITGAKGHDRFALPPTAWADVEEEGGTVLAVWHSHPDASAQPSEADRVACTASGVPWLVVGFPSRVILGCDPGYRAPLLGREFSHGVLDCYTLIQDHFQSLGITLPHYERADDWWTAGQDLYRANFANAGFVQAPGPMRPNDVLLMAINSPVPNHAAVLVREGTILHHLWGRLSCEDVYLGHGQRSSYWQRHTTHVLRHRSLV